MSCQILYILPIPVCFSDLLWAAVDQLILHRILRPGGRFVVAHFNYLHAESAVARATEALVLRWNPTWAMAAHSGDYPHLKDEIAAGGFDDVGEFVFDHPQPFTHEAWRGRIRTCNGVGSGALSDANVEKFDDELAALLREEFPAEPLIIPHRVWAVVGRKPLDT